MDEEKYPRSEMDKAGESSRKDVSASRRYQARGCYKITDEMRERYSGSKHEQKTGELFLRKKKEET